MFGGITIGLSQRYGRPAILIGFALLIGSALAVITTSLQRQHDSGPPLEALSMAGINEIAIVVGYETEHVISHVRARSFTHQHIHFIENPAFAITNNIYSLWLALDWLCEDSFVALNADVIFDSEILQSALRLYAPISMIVDPLWRDETMKVIIEGDRVIEMSKKISREEFNGTYIGITVFSKSIQNQFFREMHGLIGVGRANEFFNVAVQQLAHKGVFVGFISTEGLAWTEIDDPVDLSFAQRNIFPQLATVRV